MSIADYAGPGILGAMFEPCVRMIRADSESDGQFGTDDIWAEGASFDAMIVQAASPEGKIAEQDGIREQYRVVVRRGFPLEYGDVFRRVKNGETLRVTSRPNDREAPDASTVQIAALTAQRWEIPT